jgi:pentatricopeptide repeat protein
MAILEEMKRNGCQPNSQSYLQLLIGMSRKRHRSHVQNDRMEEWFYDFLRALDTSWRRKPPLGLLKKAMHTISFRGHPHLGHMYLKVCSLYGDLDVICWNLAIQGCVNSKNMQDAEMLLNLAREKKMVNASTYQILIEGYLKMADQKSSSRIFSLLLQDKVTPDYRIFELFIDYYLTLPAKMETYETVNRLWQAVMMITNVTVPDKMIQQLFAYFLNHDQLQYAEQIYLDIKFRKQKLNQPCLVQLGKVMIGFAKKRQLLSALSLFYDLNGEGYRVDDIVIYKIIKACIDANDKEAAQQLVKVLEELDPNAKIAQISYNKLTEIQKLKARKKICGSSSS